MCILKPMYVERVCKKHGMTTWKKRSDYGYRCCRCSTENTTNNRKTNMARLKREFGGKCQLCGKMRSLLILQFHHLDPKTKCFTIGDGVNRSFPNMVREAVKCVLLCSECHTLYERHELEIPAGLHFTVVPAFVEELLEIMKGQEGFEPSRYGLTTRCSAN
jgi:hypothetical protein